MAFIDQVTIHAKAGKGGDGVVRWLHLKGKDRGGPAGGNGGRGGDVIFVGVRDIAALSRYKFEKEFLAENGEQGDNNNKYGRDGEPVILKVPVGSVLRNTETGETAEVLHDGEEIIFFKGGQGGYGNAHFKSSTNQNPDQAKQGKPGGAGDIEITLKLIADAGLIGFPNAGKSSLLNELTKAHSKVGSYAFTTLNPHLGDYHGYVLADIPGLIEGSAKGKGLGDKFLRHIERTKVLIHLVSAERDDITEAYKAIRRELSEYSELLESKPELVLLTKVDTVQSDEELRQKKVALEEVCSSKVLEVSILDPESLKSVGAAISSLLGQS